ncbi:hypothetical protein [Chromobacterium haemolyticum]|uniref:hypothetical protein n=1 Tax=Chromobacterium TaxID=535 RepID=UPI0040571CBA
MARRNADSGITTLKNSLFVASQYSQQPQQIRQVSYGIPKAQNADPGAMAAAAHNRASRANELWGALTGMVDTANQMNDSVEATAQKEVSALIAKRKLSPEEFGRVADKSNLPFSWNPWAMKVYNRDVGAFMATKHIDAARAEVEGREDFEGMTAQEATAAIRELAIKRAAADGFDSGNDIQLAAFSNVMTPALVNVAGSVERQRSERMKKDSFQKRLGSAQAEILSVPANDQIAQVGAIDGVLASAYGISESYGKQMAFELADRFIKSGKPQHLETLLGMKMPNSELTYGEFVGDQKGMVMRASVASARLNNNGETEFKIGVDELVDGVLDLSRPFNPAEAAAKFDQKMGSLPPGNEEYRIQKERQFRHNTQRRYQMQQEEEVKQLKQSYSANWAQEAFKAIQKDPYNPITLNDEVLSIKGEQVVVSAAEKRKALVSGASSMAEKIVGGVNGANRDELSKAAARLYMLDRGLQVAGVGVAERTVFTPVTRILETAMTDPQVKRHFDKTGKWPDNIMRAYYIAADANSLNPASIPEDLKKIIGPALTLQQATGESADRALFYQEQAKQSGIRPSDKELTALYAELNKLGGTEAQAMALRDAAVTLKRSGQFGDDKEIAKHLTAGIEQNFIDGAAHGWFDSTPHIVGRIPKNIMGGTMAEKDAAVTIDAIGRGEIRKAVGDDFDDKKWRMLVTKNGFQLNYAGNPVKHIDFAEMRQRAGEEFDKVRSEEDKKVIEKAKKKQNNEQFFKSIEANRKEAEERSLRGGSYYTGSAKSLGLPDATLKGGNYFDTTVKPVGWGNQ